MVGISKSKKNQAFIWKKGYIVTPYSIAQYLSSIWHQIIYLICHSSSISHFCTCMLFRWSIFITTKLLQLESTTFALLATTPKRLAILVWVSSATLCSTGKSSPLLSDVSMNALPYRLEITNRCLKMGFGCVSAKVPVVIGLFKKMVANN